MTIDEFLEELGKLPPKYRLTLWVRDTISYFTGDTKTGVDLRDYTPITAVADNLGKGYFYTNQWKQAAEALDLSEQDAALIDDSASANTEFFPAHNIEFRFKLNKITGYVPKAS